MGGARHVLGGPLSTAIKPIRVSIIVPVFNEENTIAAILERVREQVIPGFELEVVVINDGSRDGTGAILSARPELYDHLITQENQGKGAAVRNGLRQATGDYVLFQDADLEYDPADYGKLFVPLSRFGADIVMGSRFSAPQYTRVYYFWHKVGNALITLLFNVLNNVTFSDIYSCYLCYRRNLVDPDKLRTSGWEQQAEILTKAAAAGSVFYEVPISYHGRTYEEGKKIRARHIITVFWTIFRERLFPSQAPART